MPDDVETRLEELAEQNLELAIALKAYVDALRRTGREPGGDRHVRDRG